MALPKVSVEIAFDSGFSTAEGSRTWTDVSDYVEGDQEISISYGRADELSVPDANSCSVTLDNRDGRFTPGKASSPYYPNVKKGRPLRVSVRYADEGSGNLLSANQASMETSVADWSAGGSVPPTLSWSTTHPSVGARGLLITWGTGGSLPLAATTVTGLIVGRTYTAQAQVWVPTASPNVRLVAAGTFGTVVSTKNTHAQASVTFVANATSTQIQVWPSGAAVAGNQCWVDSVMVDESSTVGTFTTNPPPVHVRFTGYVSEWPVVWPDGSSAASSVTIMAQSRKARLGQTAPLTSAIRAAYLETGPDAYWPMSDDLLNSSGQSVFLDITNTLVNRKPTQALAGFYTDFATAPVLNTGVYGPTDEGQMVKLPAFTNYALVGTFNKFVGAGTAVSINTGGYATVEVVARVSPTRPGDTFVDLIDLFSPGLDNLVSVTLADNRNSGGVSAVGGSFLARHPDTGAVLENEADGNYTTLYDAATDSQIHHYAFVLDSAGTVGRVYFDGVQVGTLSIANALTARLTNIAFGSDTYNANVWVGHGAVHARALTAAEVLAHANAATAANEAPEERVVRVAGRVGVPAGEVDAEATVGANLGPQPEAGRSAAEVLDEVATSTGGVLHDGRDGHLVMRARTSRYNVAVAFELSGELQEIQGDLTFTDDHRYTVNTIEFSRAGAEDESPSTVVDQDSIDEHGVFSQSYTVVSSSPTEVEAFAQDRLYRFADPDPRVSTVSVDLVNLSTALRANVLEADIDTRFGLADLTTQAPTDPTHVFFEGADESISAASHTMTINTTPADIYQNVLTWNDPSLGTWDNNVWAY